MELTFGERLGAGPCGESFLGRLPGSGEVVLKVLAPGFAQRPELLAQVVGEVQAFTGFAHPRGAAPLGLAGTRARPVVIFPRAPGVTLRQLLARGPLDPALALRVARDAALLLAAAHDRGLALGDLRPEKLLLDPAAGATVLDLGLARAACLASGLAAHGLAFGHPAYLAPEALEGRLPAPTPACDVYALGLVVYELLAGRHPFTGTAAELLAQQRDRPLPPPPRPLPAPVAEWLAGATAKRPERRYPHGRALVDAIYRAVGQPSPLGPAATNEDWSSDELTLEPEAAAQLDAAAAGAPPGRPFEDADPERTGSLELLLPAAPPGAPSGAAGASLAPAPPGEAAPPPAPAEADRPSAPRIRLGAELGRGSAGTTYEGELWGHSGAVVLKVLTRRFDRHPELAEEILTGLEAAKAVQGPQVLAVLEVLRGVGGRNVIVAERASGPSLREVLRREGRIAPARALRWAGDVAAALAPPPPPPPKPGPPRKESEPAPAAALPPAHPHGDLRPEKLYLGEDDHVRVADFGLARASCLTSNFGAFGLSFGHPLYLAPEVVQQGRTSPDLAADAYALGAVLYELLAGHPPFRAPTVRETLVLHLTQPPPPPQVSVPRPLAELVLRLLAKDPARRPADVEELQQAIALTAKQLELAARRAATVEVEEFSLDDDDGAGGEGAAAWERAAAD